MSTRRQEGPVMDIPVWGREHHIDGVVAVAADASRSHLIDIVAPDGAGATRLLEAMGEALGAAGIEVHSASAASAGRVSPGALAEQFGDLDEATRIAVLVGDAHCADGTSLGALARLLADRPGTIVVLEHPPIEGPGALAIHQVRLAAGTASMVHLERLTAADIARSLDVDVETAQLLVEAANHTDAGLVRILRQLGDGRRHDADAIAGGLAQIADQSSSAISRLDPTETEVLEAVTAVDRPLGTAVLAAFAEVSERDVLAAGERLAGQGLLRERAAGFEPASEPTRSDLIRRLGPARRAHTRLAVATVFERIGLAEQHPATVGVDFLEAEQWERALPYLTSAGLSLAAEGALHEAYPLIDGALRCIQNGAAMESRDRAALLLARARFYRTAGYPERAEQDLTEAAAHAEGPDRVDALGFLVAVLDDQQRPQAAATVVATAEWEAAAQQLDEKLGSLLTLRGRELERLGFAEEADRATEVGEVLVGRHGTPTQQFNAKTNRAWIAFDRGQVRQAEQLFGELVDAAPDEASLADRLVWHARALYASGHPERAQSALTRVRELGRAGGDHVLRFLAAIANHEGATLHGQWDEAEGAVDVEAGLATLLLPAWRNGTHLRRAFIHAARGDWDAAAAELDSARELTPAGADGFRWGWRIEALERIVGHARGSGWDQQAAEDLTDQMLVAQWFSAAVDLMIARCRIESDRDVGMDAAALATRLGNPMKAAEAIEAAAGWDQPEAAQVIGDIQGMESGVPEAWLESWRALPHVAAALARPPSVADTSLLDTRLEDALAAAGLRDTDAVYSPAQRAARGLVRRRPTRAPRRSWLARAGLAAAVVGVAGITGYVASTIGDPPPTTPSTVTVTVTVTQATTTTTLAIAETQIDLPDGLVGQAPFLGGPGLTGVYDASGVPELVGFYWAVPTGGPTRSAPIVVGDNVIVGGGDGNVWSVGIDGSTAWRYAMTTAIDAPVATGLLAVGSGPGQSGNERALVAADRSGRVVALRPDGTSIWTQDVGSRVSAAPVITDDAVVIATAAGTVLGLTQGEGTELWRYPSSNEDDVIGSIEFGPVASNGMLFFAGANRIVALDAETGAWQCSAPLLDAASAPASLADGYLFVPAGEIIQVVNAADCGLRTDGGRASIPMNVFTGTSPAIRDDIAYVGSGSLLAAVDVISGDEPFGQPLGAQVTGSPVVAGDVVYTSTAEQEVVALHRTSGAVLWRFPAGGVVDAPVAVIDNAVFVLTSGGRLIALGG